MRYLMSAFVMFCYQASAASSTSTAARSAPDTPVQVVLLMTAATLLPTVVMTLTPFLRITVILHFLRQALGTQSTPSNQVLLGTALFLTFVIMTPVASEVYQRSWKPFERGELTVEEAVALASDPMKRFWMPFCREKDVQLLLEITKTNPPARPELLSASIVAPAYVIGELRVGFQMGAVLFLPFLIIDLVVASVTLTVGMVQLPPVMISAPFKILLFVLADGWNLVIGSLVKSLAMPGA